jgi:hypothetical protein
MGRTEGVGEPALEGGLDGGGRSRFAHLADAGLDRSLSLLAAGVGGMENPQSPDAMRIIHGKTSCNHAAQRKTKHCGLVDLQMIEKIRELPRKERQRGSFRRIGAAAMAIKIIDGDAAGRGQRLDLPLPRIKVHAEAMNEHHAGSCGTELFKCRSIGAALKNLRPPAVHESSGLLRIRQIRNRFPGSANPV